MVRTFTKTHARLNGSFSCIVHACSFVSKTYSWTFVLFDLIQQQAKEARCFFSLFNVCKLIYVWAFDIKTNNSKILLPKNETLCNFCHQNFWKAPEKLKLFSKQFVQPFFLKQKCAFMDENGEIWREMQIKN